MKFLITGSSGFLGQYLLRRLIADGHDAVAIGRTRKENEENCEYFEADITNIKALRQCLKKYPDITGIIHLAALVPRVKDEDIASDMAMTNIIGTCNLQEVFGHKIKKFVYASTAEVYGLPKSRELIKEDCLPAPLSNYGASKLAGEHFCQVFEEKTRVATPILRYSVMYGPGDRIRRAVPNFIINALNNENLEVFGGEELRDYLHVRDAAEATYLAAISPHSNGIYNIGTGKGISIKQTAEAIVQAINPELRLNILPRSKKAADIVLDINKATDEFGFKAKYVFPDLIDEQIQWQRNN